MKNLTWEIFNLILQTYMDKSSLCLQKKTYQVPSIQITKVIHVGQRMVYTSNLVCIILGIIVKREIMEDRRLLVHNLCWMLKMHQWGHSDYQHPSWLLDLVFQGIVYLSHQWLCEYQKRIRKCNKLTKEHLEIKNHQHQRMATAPQVMQHHHNTHLQQKMEVVWWISWDLLVQAWTSKAHLTTKALVVVTTRRNLQSAI